MSKINIPDFSNAKVNDEVWDAVTNETGYIFQADCKEGYKYPIFVRFPDGESRTYTFDGCYDTDIEMPRLFWKPFEIPQECLTRPADPLPSNGTMGWGRYQNADGDQWAIGYLRKENKLLYLARTPYGATGWVPIAEFTTKDPYAKEAE